MSTPTDQQRHEQLEQRLRAAAGAVPSRPVPADAWLELQSRLASRDGHHSRRFLAAAAVVALLLALVGVAALLDDGRHSAGPAGGSGDDPWATENILGEPVTAETLTLAGRETRHELVLTDTDGKGPSLCDRYVDVGNGASSGGCTARQEHADDSPVAVDWLSGTTGGGDIHGIDAAVDSRVAKVRIYLSNGDMVLADLKPTGWEGTKMFALTLADSSGAGVPQRLVAYADAKGTVLQVVDLADVFGDTWIPDAADCQGEQTGHWPAAGSDDPTRLVVTFTARDAIVGVQDTGGTSCIDHRGAGPVVGAVTGTDDVVVLLGPEVASVSLLDPADGKAVGTVVPTAGDGTLYKVAVFEHLDAEAMLDAVLVPLDETGQALDRATVSSLG